MRNRLAKATPITSCCRRLVPMFVSSGGEHIHFDSSQFSANLSGLHSDLTYNLNSWVGLEGNVISSGGGEINHERTKYVLHAGGAHLGWGNTRKCFSPWS